MSTSERFLFKGFKILNFSLKVLIKIGSFIWDSCRNATNFNDRIGHNFV